MVVRFYLFELRGGRLLTEFEPMDATWETALNDSDTVTVTIDLQSTSGRMDWRNLATPWKHCIGVDIGGRLYGGPIMPWTLDAGEATLKITARGLQTYLARRAVLPVLALTTSLTRPDGYPNTALDTNLSGYDLGTIGKRLVQQAMSWPGCTDIPILYEDDRFGSRDRAYPAIDRKKVADALSDISGVQNGPDFRFDLSFADDAFVTWFLQSGTEARPQLSSTDELSWDLADAGALSVTIDPSRMGSVSWSEGGRTNDTTLVRMGYDKTLTDLGFPLLELESDASSSTVQVSTLDAWNASTLALGLRPWEFWTLRVPTDAPPFPHEYVVGDYIWIVVSKATPVPGGIVPPGAYRRRIVQMSGGMQSFIDITLGEVYGNG